MGKQKNSEYPDYHHVSLQEPRIFDLCPGRVLEPRQALRAFDHKGPCPWCHVGNDAAPEFSAETYPPGTAPSDRTFKPNPVDETSTENSAAPKASDTLGGATSAEVHQGLGHPGSGQTSQELHGA